MLAEVNAQTLVFGANENSADEVSGSKTTSVASSISHAFKTLRGLLSARLT